MASVLLLLLPTGNIAFFRIFSLLTIACRGTVVVVLTTVLFVMLIVLSSFIPLIQLPLQLMITLGELLNCRSEGLHLSFQGIGRVPSLLVDGNN